MYRVEEVGSRVPYDTESEDTTGELSVGRTEGGSCRPTRRRRRRLHFLFGNRINPFFKDEIGRNNVDHLFDILSC